MNPQVPLTPYEPAVYRLRLQGCISVNWDDWLENVSTHFDNDVKETIVTGIVRDHAALFGMLSFLRDLGVILIGIEFIQK
jgi:hypothetical protein